MTGTFTPERWANNITVVLNALAGQPRFPLQMAEFAKAYSHQRFPDDPILSVKGDRFSDFEGGLFRVSKARSGWGIVYNQAISSPGRINFTLAHEFGHYLLHRATFPNGLSCGAQDVVRWDDEYRQVEHQANVFAASVLMPLDDFRRQIPAKTCVNLDMIGHCADRYGVSLIAATLRWLSYTEKRALLVVSRDGYILWARSSDSAFTSGRFFKTSGRPPIEVPPASLAMTQDRLVDGRASIDHGERIWFDEPVREMTIFAEQYDFAISLLLLGDERPWRWREAPAESDTYDRLAPAERRREW